MSGVDYLRKTRTINVHILKFKMYKFVNSGVCPSLNSRIELQSSFNQLHKFSTNFLFHSADTGDFVPKAFYTIDSNGVQSAPSLINPASVSISFHQFFRFSFNIIRAY